MLVLNGIRQTTELGAWLVQIGWSRCNWQHCETSIRWTPEGCRGRRRPKNVEKICRKKCVQQVWSRAEEDGMAQDWRQVVRSHWEQYKAWVLEIQIFVSRSSESWWWSWSSECLGLGFDPKRLSVESKVGFVSRSSESSWWSWSPALSLGPNPEKPRLLLGDFQTS